MKHRCGLKFVKTPLENPAMGMLLLFVRGIMLARSDSTLKL